MLATICAPNTAYATTSEEIDPGPGEPEEPECCLTEEYADYRKTTCGGRVFYNYYQCPDGSEPVQKVEFNICGLGDALIYNECTTSGEWGGEETPECPAGEYANGMICSTCPAPGTSNEGSQSITDCCIRNYTGTDEKGTYHIGECCYTK